ncbi:MAG: Xaa-Pro peptidase family protein [Rhodospirillaceae bacterium]|nr:Xaa-Pro peptidase family protein [Rhodospirillaceae bacterium]
MLDNGTSAPPQTRDRWNLLAFPIETYRARLASVQSDLTDKGLAGCLLFDPENIYWLTGYQTIGYFTFQALYVSATGLPTLVSRFVNRDLALAHPTIGDVAAVTDTDDPIGRLIAFLKDGGRAPLGIETTSWYLTAQDYTRLMASDAGPFADWTGVIEAWRPAKSDAEIERMRRAARAAEAGLDAAIKAVAPGKTENDIAAAMFEASIAAGSEYLGHPPLVVTGETTALCFAMWRRRTVEVGDVVLLETAGCIDRYHAMLSRPVVVGEPQTRHRQAADALRDVLEAAVESIRPGRTSGEVDERCRQVVERQGLGRYFKHRAAYGIGIGFPPNWSEGHIYAIRPDDPLVLEPNMTFHVIPTLFLDDFGMCFSDSVQVTEDGCELLTQFPRDLFVIEP